MRTNVEIDDELMRQAMKASKTTTKKAAVEEALRLVVQLKRQEGISRLFGKVQWEGNLDEMRASRFPDWDEGREKDRGIADTPAA
jgi:Arc/MetJ family transcription regulator